MSSRAWALFVAMSLVWGLPYLLIKVAVSELDPLLVVFARLAMAAVILAPIAILSNSLKRTRKSWRRLALVATEGIILPFLLIAFGEQHITSSLAALLVATDPLFVVLLALPFDASERPSGLRLIGLLIGLVGVAVLLGLDLSGDAQAALGAVMVLVAAACYALSALTVKGLRGVPMLGSVTVTLSLASILLAPMALTRLPSTLPSLTVLGALVALGLVCTAVAYVLYFSLINEAGATRASIITYINPAVAVFLGVLVLGEPLSVGTVAGFGLIVLGCALSTGALRRSPRGVQPRRIPSAELVEGDVS
jgi:drug/metabolite transporter (DMT)-like permease